jgi:hypothetical protein
MLSLLLWRALDCVGGTRFVDHPLSLPFDQDSLIRCGIGVRRATISGGSTTEYDAT